MNEQTLRNWVREVMGRDVSWVEPSFGSSVGKPDAEFNINNLLFPVELKWAEERNKRLIINLRPAQYRYHVMNAKRGMKTAIMYGLKVELGFMVEMLAGVNCQTLHPRWLVKMSFDNHDTAKFRIITLLTSKEFWE